MTAALSTPAATSRGNITGVAEPTHRPPTHSKARLLRRRMYMSLLSWLVITALIVMWWVVTTFEWVPAGALASPAEVAHAATRLAASGELWAAIGASLARVVAGVAIGVVAGLALGVVAGLSVVGQAVVDRPLQMLRILPFNALVPLVIVFAGIGEPMKVVVVAYAVAIPLYINTFAGIRDGDRALVEVAHVYRVPRLMIAWQVLLRGALPQVLTGMRFALGIAWIALVTVEVVNAGTGLGFVLNQAQQFARTDVMLLVVLLYGVLGGLTDWAVRALERTLLRWRNAYAGA